MSSDHRVPARSWRARLGGIRIRSALAAATVVAVAVAVAGAAMVLTAQLMLTGNIDSAATQRADQVVAAIRAGDPALLEQTLRPAPGDQTIVQVLNPAGDVVAASAVLAGKPPITAARPVVGAVRHEQLRLTPGSEDAFRAVTTAVATDDGVRTVVAAQSLRPVDESIEAVTRTILVGAPLLALVVGIAVFVFVGRSLRPVEAIRRRVAGITARDLTARVPVPAARDEVAALAETMNTMLERLQDSADAQNRFVADASHELRSPLTTLQVGLEVLAASGTAGATQVARLQAETERLSRLVADLLLLARTDEHGMAAARREDVDLDDIAYIHRDRLQHQHPDLRVSADVVPVRIRGDAHHLDRAVANLCDNAARHARSRIAITVRADATTAHLVVADDGPGIAPADRDRAFDRFVRLDSSRTRTDGGAGLGLAITRDIVHDHDGTVTAESSHLGGAALHIRLPMRTTTATAVVSPLDGSTCGS
ncbi:two-component sensor histidine kinase [Catellatospora sp. TT07R-123]|uniref:sensor histidine kinase n=1 Tax=Catellatospora sp. TT07R-123 TaxID=2733863 RepID=UPI001B2963DF|nr:ATP-binding protein [Catellatospora sp. TT07R-123]GHJ43396.1 two-component sensor histidine kinase [Catellatospora sp. TT07R-123]